ncbi:aspartate/glutamate racemase family protein [Brevibacterium sp.]|uniref:aspartate/glutamate racemase family protein n=1 Tax=Brevibacterium sp. TaxID=1701 RepID=UPI0028115C4F|nr:aspartate/glutamate racemase family protein [Brevibacterium sp.]
MSSVTTAPAGTTARPTVGGAGVGIIVLDTGFERLPGDIAHTATWPFPVQFRIVRGVRPADVITGDPAAALAAFEDAIDDLVDHGAQAIATSCGFLAAVQKELAAYSPVPFASSPLLQIPLAEATLPEGRQVGLVVSDPEAIDERHFRGVGARPGLPFVGLDPQGPILTTMRENARVDDPALLEADALEAIDRLVRAHPEVGAIVLECANLPPYSAAIARRFARPVYDAVTLVTWLQSGIAPRRYPR